MDKVMTEPAKKPCTLDSIERQLYNIDNFDHMLFHSQFVKTKQRLSQHYAPRFIDCRDKEKKQIQDFIKQGIENRGMEEALYISGVPGIGKTLCVRDITEKVIQQSRSSNISIYLNAMMIKNPYDIFRALFTKLTGQKKSSYPAVLYILDDLFRKGKSQKNKYDKLIHKNKIIVIDEIDYLYTKDQEILYNLFDWLRSKYGRLIIIAISNTIDFPQTLSPKILSRIGSKRLIFKPYHSQQIEHILKGRIMLQEGKSIFETNSIQYICKKIALCSSDIRKCMTVVREAIDLYLDPKNKKEKDGKVTIPFCIKAHEAIYNNSFQDIYFELPISHKKVLACLAHHFRFQYHSIGIRELKKKTQTAYGMDGEDVREVLLQLKDMNIILMNFSKKKVSQARGKLKHLQEEHISLKIDNDKILQSQVKEAHPQIMIST